MSTGEILASISASMTDPQPVFDAIVRNGSRLLGTQQFNVMLLRDGTLHMLAATRELLLRHFPRPLDQTTAAGQAMLTKQVVQYSPVIGEGSVAPSTTQSVAREFGFNSVLAAPMVHKDIVIGAITTARREAKAFDDKQVALIKAFADQAVIAIENARLFEEVQARTRELQEALDYQTATSDVLNVISRSTTDVQPVFDAIVNSAAKLFDPCIVNINSLEDGQLIYRAAASVRYELNIEAAKSFYPIPFDPERSVASRAILEQRIVEIPDAAAPDLPESM